MSDLISREDAKNYIDSQKGRPFIGCTIGEAMKIMLDEVPSAEPERKWIPFDVALPKDRQKVLCVNKHDEMMVGRYRSDYGMTFPCYFEKPIAWMPLPEPWRGER